MRRSWIRTLEAALSGVLVGLLAAGPAFAQPPPLRLLPRVLPSAAAPKLTVLVLPLDTAAQAQVLRLQYLAEQGAAASGRFEIVPLADALDAQGTREREAKAAEAAALFKAGQKAYDELDTQKAAQEFDKAAQAYESSNLSRHFADMSRARVMKIASFVANGDNKGFVRELKEVLARNPHAEFSPNYFPPDELAVVEKTRKAILSEANRSLEVKTGQVSGWVFVDGQFQGISPVTLSGLTSSEHFVTVIAPGYTLTQGKARGEASFTLQPVPAAKRLKALEERIADDPDGLERDTALRELGLLAGAQQVVALMVRGSPGVAGAQGATAVRIDASDGHNLAYATAPVPLAGEAMDAGIQSLVASVLKADAPRVEGKPGHIPALKVSSGRKTAGYVLLATGAALLVGGVYFGLSASSKASDFKNTPQRSAQAETLKSDGQRFALIADIGFIAGLASAGAGSWLAFARGGGGETAEQASSRPAPAPARPVTPPPSREPTPVARPAEKPVAPAPAPQSKPSANTRAEEERRAREEAAKREEEDKRKREEAARREEEDKRRREEEARKKQGEAEAAKRAEEAKRQEAAKRAEEAKRQEEAKRAEEEKRKREEEERKKQEEEKRKREEEAKKKKPALDDDDLRNY